MNPYFRTDQNYIITRVPDMWPDTATAPAYYTWNFGSNYFSPYIYNEYFSDLGRLMNISDEFYGRQLSHHLSKPYNLHSGLSWVEENATHGISILMQGYTRGISMTNTGDILSLPGRVITRERDRGCL
jgi:hypothetical protein